MGKEADPGDTHYPTIRLNVWFAASSILFLGCVFWMVLDDYNREWKRWQRVFREKESQLLERKLAEYQSPEKVKELEEINRAIREAEAAIAADRKKDEETESALVSANAAKYVAEQRVKKLKADLVYIKFEVEEERYEGADLVAGQARVDEVLRMLDGANKDFEQAERRVAEAAAKRRALLAPRAEAEAKLAAATLERDRHARNLELLTPRTAEGKLTKLLRDLPGLDFAAPSLTVNKVVLEDRLYFDLKFPGKRKTRVDMCMTCHVPIDRPGKDYLDEPNPLKTHPRLNLFLADSSPHPMKDFGCTICHSGSGETLTFIHSDHTPRDERQRQEWEANYHWEKMHHWELPMLPLQYTEASCYQCHRDHMELVREDAPTLYKAVTLVEKAGCYACHKIQGPWGTLRKPGPPLRSLKAKVVSDWAYEWIAEPAKFRPTTWMPQVFHLSNITDADRAAMGLVERENLAVNAIVEYLWWNAEPFAVEPPPVKGDPKRGAETIQLRGCLACHTIAGVNDRETGNDWNDFGPDLSGVGSKLTEGWLYQWVKNPKGYFPKTRMPDLRLTDQDAADIAAYLASLKKEGWQPRRPPVNEALLRSVALEFLEAEVDQAPVADLRKAVAGGGASRQDMLLYVGEKYIFRQGCFGCHDIPGVKKDGKTPIFKEDETPIGTELTEWGSKDLDKLDYGNFLAEANPDRMEKTRHDWAKRKLRDPRVYDKGKIKSADELLRMPKFRFSDEQVELVTTFLLGLVRDDVPLHSKPRLSEAKETLARGATLVRQNNCQGCHVFDDEKVVYRDPEDGLASVRGVLRWDEDGEVYVVQLREPSASGARRTESGEWEGGEVGSAVWFGKEQLVAAGKRQGGGLFASLERQASKGFTLLDNQGKPQSRGYEGSELEPYAPPSLVGEGRRVQADWIYGFLKDPTTIRPAVPVKMPTFELTDAEASTIAQWFVRREQEKWPAEFTNRFRIALGVTRLQFAKECKIGKDDEEAFELMERLESGQRVGPELFQKVLALAKEKKWSYDAPPSLPFEEIAEQKEVYLAAKELKHPGYLKKGRELVANAQAGACFNCHGENGHIEAADPFTWAPDLALFPKRLRSDWLRRWLADPQKILPGTKMPVPAVGSGASETIFPGTFSDRIEAMKDYLMNWEQKTP